jgi:hypothetical protein
LQPNRTRYSIGIAIAVILAISVSAGVLFIHSQSGSLPSSSVTRSQNRSPYSLQLETAGSGIFSNLSIPQPRTPIEVDMQGLEYHGWEINGLADLQPDVAWFSANKTGFTLSDQTCDGPVPKDCGPYETWNGQQQNSNYTELGAGLYDVPENLTNFSIYVSIPYYSFFDSCVYSTNSAGCSYEGSSPEVVAGFEIAVSGTSTTNSISINIAEVRGNESSPNELLISADSNSIVCGAEGCSGVAPATLNRTVVPLFTPSHEFSIETNDNSSISLYVDRMLVYSNNSMQNFFKAGTGLALGFYQLTSVNNETSSTTWSNFSAYSDRAANITVTGLSPKMWLEIIGPGGFEQVSGSANSTGVATVDVSQVPGDLELNILEGSSVVARFDGTVSAGAALNLIH